MFLWSQSFSLTHTLEILICYLSLQFFFNCMQYNSLFVVYGPMSFDKCIVIYLITIKMQNISISTKITLWSSLFVVCGPMNFDKCIVMYLTTINIQNSSISTKISLWSQPLPPPTDLFSVPIAFLVWLFSLRSTLEVYPCCLYQ